MGKRRNRSPEQEARRAKIRELLQESNIGSLFKMLYLAMMDITKKRTGRRQDWGVIHSQLSIYFADRMPD